MNWQTDTSLPKVPDIEQHVQLTPGSRLLFRRCEYRDVVAIYIDAEDWHGGSNPPAIADADESRSALLTRLLPEAERALAELRAELAKAELSEAEVNEAASV